jgi:hypothetical protein
MATALFLVPERAEAQVRTARPRAVVVRPPLVRSHVVGRPVATVFVGGFHFPSLYRASLYYGPRYGYPGGYHGGYHGAPYYQWPGGFGYGYDSSGSVRLQVQPREAEVFIDGYYAGTVDDFDGVFQRLHIEPGDHDVLVYLPGHRPFEQRVYLQPGKTFSIRHTMEPLAPGEPEPARPAGVPATSPRDPGAGAPGPRPRPPASPPGAPDARASNVRDFGQLSLRVQPGDAEVVIDGERWEGALENERLVVQLGAGVHRLEIRKEGYRSYFTDVTVRGGETRTLNVALTRQ